MPNWCSNKLIIESDDHDFLNEIIDQVEKGTFLNSIVPMPEEFLQTNQWYSWRKTYWGTKWEIEAIPMIRDYIDLERLKKGVLEFSFGSADRPPSNAIFELLSHPKVNFGRLYYAELGDGICGYLDSEGDESDIDIEEFSEAWITDNIPEDLIEAMNLDASFEEDSEEDEVEEDEYLDQPPESETTSPVKGLSHG